MANVLEPLDPSPSSISDIRLTEDISQQMNVPQHISVTGESHEDDPYQGFYRPSGAFNKGEMDGELAKSRMNVPDRILVAGGDSHQAARHPPREIQLDMETLIPKGHSDPVMLSTPPSTLTVRHTPADDDENVLARLPASNDDTGQRGSDDRGNETSSENEFFQKAGIPQSEGRVLLNPTDELLRLRKQMTRLATRMIILENDLDSVRTREYLYLTVAATYFLVKVARYLFFKGSPSQ